MEKTFMCDIITRISEEHTDLEQVLIKAHTPTGAFEKLVTVRHYKNVKVYDQRENALFAHVEVEDGKLPVLHILIGEPTETIE